MWESVDAGVSLGNSWHYYSKSQTVVEPEMQEHIEGTNSKVDYQILGKTNQQNVTFFCSLFGGSPGDA